MGATQRSTAALMGTTVTVLTVDAPSQLNRYLLWRLESLEAAWSRFRPDSEVSTLNRRAGEFVHVSDETFELVEKAVFAKQVSGGRFDPLLLAPLEALGYDQTFSEVERVDAALPEAWHRPFEEIVVDHASSAVRIPVACGFDPGGIGKGLAADLVAGEAIDRGATGVMVSIGGDIRVIGTPPDGPTWGIRLREATVDDDLDETLGLLSGAVATSTSKKRAWGPGRHHLLDATTARPLATNDDGSHAVLVTVVAGEAWYADAMTKACFADPAVPLDGVSALVVTEAGNRSMTGAFESFLATEGCA